MKFSCTLNKKDHRQNPFVKTSQPKHKFSAEKRTKNIDLDEMVDYLHFKSNMKKSCKLSINYKFTHMDLSQGLASSAWCKMVFSKGHNTW